MGRQTFHQAAAFHAANGGQPAVLGKGVGQPGAEGVGGVGPQVLAVIGTVDVFFKVEFL